MHTDDITTADKRLLEVITQIGYGRLENLELRNGTVIAANASCRVRSYKPERACAVKQPTAGAFKLKDCQAEFLQRLHAIGNGFIRVIVIQDGLPIHVEMEDTLTTI